MACGWKHSTQSMLRYVHLSKHVIWIKKMIFAMTEELTILVKIAFQNFDFN